MRGAHKQLSVLWGQRSDFSDSNPAGCRVYRRKGVRRLFWRSWGGGVGDPSLGAWVPGIVVTGNPLWHPSLRYVWGISSEIHVWWCLYDNLFLQSSFLPAYCLCPSCPFTVIPVLFQSVHIQGWARNTPQFISTSFLLGACQYSLTNRPKILIWGHCCEISCLHMGVCNGGTRAFLHSSQIPRGTGVISQTSDSQDLMAAMAPCGILPWHAWLSRPPTLAAKHRLQLVITMQIQQWLWNNGKWQIVICRRGGRYEPTRGLFPPAGAPTFTSRSLPVLPWLQNLL